MSNDILYLSPSRQPNNIGVNGYGTEAQNMMIVAKKVKAILSGRIKKVHLNENNITLSQAIVDSNNKKSTLHLEIHSDAGGGRGSTGLYKSDKGKKFISAIYNHVSAVTPSADRGLSYRTDLGALNQTNAVAGLIECFFHDNADDVAFYKTSVNIIAQAIADGILEYLGITNTGNPVNTVVTSTPATPAPSDNMTLYLQKVLNRLWFTDASNRVLVLDGVPGPNTTAAIKKFQDAMNLSVDGIAGSITQNAISDILLKPVCSIDRYNRNATRYIQWRLGIAHDGVYGPQTKGRVQSYQRDMGLTPDGVAGNETWNKLI